MIDKNVLLGALIGLARASDGNPPSEATHRVLLEGLLFLSSGQGSITLEQIHAEKHKLIPGCANCASPCGRTADYDMQKFKSESEALRMRKVLLLSALYGMAPTIYRVFLAVQETLDNPETLTDQKTIAHQEAEEFCMFLYRALFAIGEDWEESYLDFTLQEAGEIALKLYQNT